MSTCPTSNQGYTETTIQLKALQTRILKMENYEKCWPHHCMDMGDEKIMVFPQRPIASGKPEAKIIQKRGAQAAHSRRESLKSNSSQEPRAFGKPDALFSSRSDELGNQFESFMFKYADPSILGMSFFECNKDHVLCQARSELVKQEHQFGSLNSCIHELQQQAYAQGLESQDAHHGCIESRREQAHLQEDPSVKEQ